MSSCAVERHLVWAEAPALKTCVEKLSTRPSQALSFFSFSILHLCLFLSQYVTIRLMPACWICFCCFCLSLNLIRRKVRFKKTPKKNKLFFFVVVEMDFHRIFDLRWFGSCWLSCLSQSIRKMSAVICIKPSMNTSCYVAWQSHLHLFVGSLDKIPALKYFSLVDHL